ncbi:hypothetical protein JCGZ_21100 [Jatropha curcas]|uniref:Pentatricopeptide repeat-containing protein n=1 Tax=Jatropha curcas TaxID=180498 RepID=A0A067JQ99_JATCU|nr:hypothetical protein JCGZ_21100 [Jatropha curcas]
MEKLGCYPSVFTFNALIDGLCKAGKLKTAQLLFCKMEIGRNPSLFLRLSQGANRVLDVASLQNMVEQLCGSGLIVKAYNILTQIADSGFAPDILTYNILINGFCRAGNINGAFKLFRELQLKGLSLDSVTYGTLINGFFLAKRNEDAFRMFDEMLKNGCAPTSAVYKSLMTWSCRRKNVSLAFGLWLQYLQNVSGRDKEVIKTLGEYFDKGEVEKAVRQLLEMDLKLNDFQLAPYTIWLIGLCQAERLEEALNIFFILKEHKIMISPPSCVKLINGLCKEGNLDFAAEIFLYTIEEGYMLMPRICNRLLKCLLCSEDKRYRALDLLSRMKSLGYDLNAYLHRTTKLHLQGEVDGVQIENGWKYYGKHRWRNGIGKCRWRNGKYFGKRQWRNGKYFSKYRWRNGRRGLIDGAESIKGGSQATANGFSQSENRRYKGVNSKWTKPLDKRHCDYCNKDGHTREKCFQLHGFPENFKSFKGKSSSYGYSSSPSRFAADASMVH